MGNKQKGAKTERELLKMLSQNNFRAARVAGSGIADESPCDLIVGNRKKKYCIECKSSKSKKKYLSKEQIEDFLIFSEMIGMKPLIAIRFNHEGWFFLDPKYIEKTKTALAISLNLVKKKGRRFGQVFGSKKQSETELKKLTKEILNEMDEEGWDE